MRLIKEKREKKKRQNKGKRKDVKTLEGISLEEVGEADKSKPWGPTTEDIICKENEAERWGYQHVKGKSA